MLIVYQSLEQGVRFFGGVQESAFVKAGEVALSERGLMGQPVSEQERVRGLQLLQQEVPG